MMSLSTSLQSISLRLQHFDAMLIKQNYEEKNNCVYIFLSRRSGHECSRKRESKLNEKKKFSLAFRYICVNVANDFCFHSILISFFSSLVDFDQNQ